MKKKVLTLSVSKQWFNMISAAEKKEEYREIKPYWLSRLIFRKSNENPFALDRLVTGEKVNLELMYHPDKVGMLRHCIDEGYCAFKPFTHVLFINGYGDDKPRVEKEIESISIGKPKQGWCPDEFLDKEYFVIKLK